MYIYKGELYLEKNHIKLLKSEPEYVKQRYRIVVSLLSPKSNVTRQKAAQTLGLSKRQFQRIIKRYHIEGIQGLRHQSKRPNRSPNKTPIWLEDIIVKVREETGFGSFHISEIVNISLENQRRTEQVIPRTVSRILLRRGIIESEKRAKKDWKRFEWGHPNHLIQTDLTRFNGIPILTMEDDYSRKG